jgi:hypothetical protein
MNIKLKDAACRTAIGVAVALALPPGAEGHEQPVHEQIALGAFRSSRGAALFLSDQLGASYAPFASGPTLVTRPSDYPANRPDSPMGWLGWGAYMEDEEDPEIPAISPAFIEGDNAQYYFQQPIDGVTITFPIEFVRENGIWKILEY